MSSGTYNESKPGLQDDVNKVLKEVDKASIPTERRYIGLLIVKVKEGLVYNKTSEGVG